MKLPALLPVACAAIVSVPLGSQHVEFRDDAGAFEAVVRYAADSAGRVRVRVDPRPFSLTTGFDGIGGGRPAYEPEVTAARRAVLARLHVDTVDALVVGMNDTCPSAMAILDDTARAAVAYSRRGCPKDILYVLAIGLPHAVQALHPPVDSDPCFHAKSCWTVLVQQSYVTPSGANMVIDQYFLDHSGAEWRVLRRNTRTIVE